MKNLSNKNQDIWESWTNFLGHRTFILTDGTVQGKMGWLQTLVYCIAIAINYVLECVDYVLICFSRSIEDCLLQLDQLFFPT
jgi:hypothetical protein